MEDERGRRGERGILALFAPGGAAAKEGRKQSYICGCAFFGESRSVSA